MWIPLYSIHPTVHSTYHCWVNVPLYSVYTTAQCTYHCSVYIPLNTLQSFVNSTYHSKAVYISPTNPCTTMHHRYKGRGSVILIPNICCCVNKTLHPVHSFKCSCTLFSPHYTGWTAHCTQDTGAVQMSPRTQGIWALLAALHLERGCEIPGIRQIQKVCYG